MANRYWVGGSGAWNYTDTSHWSASSGGAGGASVPGNGDPIIFDANSGSGTITVSMSHGGSEFLTCGGIDSTGLSGSQNVVMTGVSPFPFNVQARGNIALKNTKINQFFNLIHLSTGTYNISMDVTDATVDYPSAPSYFSFSMGSSGLTVNLTSKCAFVNFNCVQGVLNTNNNDITVASGSFNSGSNVSLGSSTIRTRASWLVQGTFNAGTSTFNVFSDPGFTGVGFQGNGKTWYNVNVNATYSQNVNGFIQDSATVNNFSFTDTNNVMNQLTFTAGATLTVNGTLTLPSGTSQKPLPYVTNTPGSAATISKTSGTINVYYVTLKDNTASGGATFNARNSSTVSNVTGWNLIGFLAQGTAIPFLR